MRAEEIYDAAIDDGAFAQLATRMAQAIGARSGVIHWYDNAEGIEHGSFSNHFSNDQMAAFDRDFADCDLWAAAVNEPAHVNRVWDLETLVSPAAYANSRIYNEWIRPMGDDTFHCLGAAIRTERGTGNIGFHRGKGQGPFEAAAIRTVKNDLVHLQRMIELRSKLAAGRNKCSGATSALDSIGHAVFSLRSNGHLIHGNLAAERFLQMGDALVLRDGRLEARLPKDDALLKTAIARAACAAGPAASALFVHGWDGRTYGISVAAVGSDLGARHITVVLSDPRARDETMPARLRALYGLTAAEAEVAVRLSEGVSLEILSQERSVSIATVRSQLKTLFAKLDCSSQSQLVAIVNRLPAFSAVT